MTTKHSENRFGNPTGHPFWRNPDSQPCWESGRMVDTFEERCAVDLENNGRRRSSSSAGFYGFWASCASATTIDACPGVLGTRVTNSDPLPSTMFTHTPPVSISAAPPASGGHHVFLL